MKQRLIIGDIHGCYYELQALLDKAALNPGDEVIGLGDVVDRGPETPQVATYFQETPNARAIMGNHERKHVRGARHELKLAISQQISMAQFADTYPAVLEWMEALPLFIDLDEALIVHGYVEPELPVESQNPSILCGTMGGDKILRERYDRPWYELYDGNKPVIVGHLNYTNTDQPFIYRDRVFGLDTSCVTGKALTGLILPSFQFVSVPSRGNLWLQVRRSYQKPERPAPPRIIPVWSAEQKSQMDLLHQKLELANVKILSGLEALPGYAELSPRQQTRLYAEHAGKGKLQNLLQLTRLGRLDLDLMQIVIHEPELLAQLDVKINALLQ